ncbi:16S rRNA (cytosine(1407)-C(5))-methyltransferase RsmF [Ferrimonas sp. SCSIO 43195]|uniref:16S rRNA (cytosine(1407)-C(5))-methyltransferase RsmF n=1 Tax=Ferrimonas sp. SCSIO 43195 TaxID=2822844 RepID=UPI0020751700|nr:16S rRNA (cytosine(1407)-C(5))-methyltransferase RsmF [Ferrimonas sp. SCSIO 43195]USD39561.1 16S rRNA (cytosine(1407)-C(5))-methyltransferase RsmF [Ferrimonas sp. SCSIO 43195]
MAHIRQDFLNSISEILPEHLNMDDFVRYSQMPLRRSIRINTLKIDCPSFIAMMQPKGWQFEPVPWCDCGYWLTRDDESTMLGNTIEHLAGLFYIQEASSMMPPTAMASLVTAPGAVLDVASAPGSKTTQLAAWMGNDGVLIANEYSASRLKGLHANLQRLGIGNVNLTHFDGRVFGPTLPECFDAVLLDAPCSGEGTLRKDPDSLNNWSLASTESIAAMQRDLIESAFVALKPGGVLVYSTCTLNHRENQDVCHHLSQRFPDAVSFEDLSTLFDDAHKAITPEGFLHIWPQVFDSEGFFIAAIRKTQSVDSDYRKPRLGRFPFGFANRKQTAELEAHLHSQFGLALPDSHTLMSRDNELWLFPSGSDAFIDKIRMQRLGLKAAECHKHGIKISHQLVMLLGQDSPSAMALTDDQAVQYLQGRDLAMDNPDKRKGEVIVSYRGFPLGLAKWVNNKLKNSLPRELVRDKVALK